MRGHNHMESEYDGAFRCDKLKLLCCRIRLNEGEFSL